MRSSNNCSASPSSEREGFERRLAAMERDGQIMRNRRDAICVVDQARPDHRPRPGASRRFRLPDAATTAGRICSSDRRRCTRCCMATACWRAKSASTGAAGRKARSSRCSSAAISAWSAACTTSTACCFVVAENRRISQDILVPPGDSLGAKAGQVVMVGNHRAARKHAQPIARIVEVLGNYADPGMEIEIALRKHDLPHEFLAGGRKGLCASFDGKVTAQDMRRARGRARAAAGDDRRRDRAGFRRRGLLRAARARASGWSSRSPTSAIMWNTAMRSTARRSKRGNSVYFPRRVIPMLPESAVERAVLAQSARRPSVHGVRHERSTRTATIAQLPLLPGGDALARAADLYRVAAMLENPQGAAAAEHRALVPHLHESATRLYHSAGKSRAQARRDRFRDDRDADDLRRARQDRAHRAGRAQRRAPPDRGMHAGGERLRLRLPAR